MAAWHPDVDQYFRFRANGFLNKTRGSEIESNILLRRCVIRLTVLLRLFAGGDCGPQDEVVEAVEVGWHGVMTFRVIPHLRGANNNGSYQLQTHFSQFGRNSNLSLFI